MHLKKLFGKMRKRLAKKFIGHPSRWEKLANGLKLKPGDLVSSCKGYNERIAEIDPCMRYTRTGWVIVDFSLQTVGGGGCSLMHCCTFPLETREEVIAYHKHWGTPEAIAYCEKGGWGFSADPKVTKCMEGKGEEVFDENGEPYYDYCNIWERKSRFPDRLRDEMVAQAEVRNDAWYGKAADYDEAYIEGWASFLHAWPNEENPYPKHSRTYWGYADGRRHAVEVGYARTGDSQGQGASGVLPGG